MNYLRCLAISILFVASALMSTAADAPALHGYCPVAYTELHKAVKGDVKYASKVKGHTYLFVNADAKKMFDKNPEKVLEQIVYDGHCTTALSMGKMMDSDPNVFSVYKGKVYLFSSSDARMAFDKNPEKMIEMANSAHKEMMKKK